MNAIDEIEEIKKRAKEISDRITFLHDQNISMPIQSYDRLLTLKSTLDEYLEAESMYKK